MAHQNFDHSEFESVRYYLGTYGCTGSTNRVNYYTITGTPTLWFNGTHKIVGAGTDAATGEGYMDIIRSRYFDPSPIRIEVDGFNPASGAVSVTVTMYSTTFSIASENFHIVLMEDDVNTAPATYDDTHLTRDVFSDTISLTGQGNTVTFNHTFVIDPSWDTTKLRVVAFVQLQDKTIIQTGSGDWVPDFRVRAMVPTSRSKIGPSSGTYETDDVTVMNVGLGETFTVDVVIDEAPAGWSVAFKDSVGTTHTTPLMFFLNGDESTTFKAVAMPNSPGYMRYSLVVNSPSLAKPLVVPFVYISNDVDVLVVDDDGGESYEDYFTAALQSAGKSFGVWDRGTSQLTAEVANNFRVLIWNAGFASPTLDADDQAFLADFLDDGNGLFMSGQDVGWELNEANPAVAWYHTYLHATYIRDDTNIYNIFGVSGDPITDGLDLVIQGGTGANNQAYPDEIAPYDADATMILNYQGNYGAAIRSTDSVSGAKVVYLGFGFEGIDNAQDRHDLLVPAVRWIQGVVFEDGFESGDTSAWSSVTP